MVILPSKTCSDMRWRVTTCRIMETTGDDIALLLALRLPPPPAHCCLTHLPPFPSAAAFQQKNARDNGAISVGTVLPHAHWRVWRYAWRTRVDERRSMVLVLHGVTRARKTNTIFAAARRAARITSAAARIA